MIVSAYINGKKCVSPIQLGDLKISLSFNQTIQPDIENQRLTFVLQDKLIIDSWINEGKIFEGIPLLISVSNGIESINVFDGIIDLNDYAVIDSQSCEVTIKKIDGLNQLDTRLSSATFNLLRQRGFIKPTDYNQVDFIVEKEVNLLEQAMLSLSIYIFYKQIQDNVKDAVDKGANSAALTVTGVTGGAASGLYTVIVLAVRFVYYTIMVIQLIALVKDLFSFFYSPVRTHRAISFKKAFERISEYLGYRFDTDISEMERTVYLPSNQSDSGEIKIGLPNSGDFGYLLSEFFDLSRSKWNTKVAVIDGVLHVKSIDSPFWDRLASYEITEVEETESSRFNNSDLVGAYVVQYDTDINDVWTVKNIDNTIFGNKTYLKSFSNEQAILINGFERINMNVCLGNRKESLNVVENTLKAMGKVVDELTGVFGRGTNFSNQIKSRVGMLKVSSEYHSKPKILYMKGRNLDPRNKIILGAENTFKTWHKRKSFTADNYRNQKRVYENKIIPMGFEGVKAFEKTNRAKFKGQTVEVTKLEWECDKDFAVISFEKPEIYTRNLIEIES